jgi:2,4-dienoyl-CoA reductase-like NADH-dependent reductase (Old Yellow Enzyme family)
MVEASAVSPEGRISPADCGIWGDAHAEAFAPIARFIREQGAIAGIQLAHAGRKGPCAPPWLGGNPLGKEAGGWQPLAPSAVPFAPGHPRPHALTLTEMDTVEAQFRAATKRALAAGFQVVELHMAHGYLLHEFLSPLGNQRTDDYGGGFEGRTRLLREVVMAIRAEWPDRLPLFVRISATDYAEGGWDLDQSIELSRQLKGLGVDLIDCSSGGNVSGVRIPLGPGYQVPFAERIRRDAGIPTAAVGLITEPAQADHIIRTGQADLVMLARELLRDPYWPLKAAQKLGVAASWPAQYLRAAPPGSPTR